MFIELNDPLKELLKETARQLKGAEKRKFIAQTVLKLGNRGITIAELELGWNRITINKGIKELTTGITCTESFLYFIFWKSLRLIVSRIAQTSNSMDTELFCFHCREYFYRKCNRVYSTPKRLNQNTLA